MKCPHLGANEAGPQQLRQPASSTAHLRCCRLREGMASIAGCWCAEPKEPWGTSQQASKPHTLIVHGQIQAALQLQPACQLLGRGCSATWPGWHAAGRVKAGQQGGQACNAAHSCIQLFSLVLNSFQVARQVWIQVGRLGTATSTVWGR